MEKQLTPENILQTGMAFWPSKTLLCAVEIGVFTELAQGPASLDSLQKRLGLHPRASRDFLDTLVALGFLKREGDRYSNTPETDLYLDRKKLSYIGGILEMTNRRLYLIWNNLTEALRTGEPQNECKNNEADLFETLYGDAAGLREFLTAMTGVSHASNTVIANSFPWQRYQTFVDIGTAQGDLAVQIALANPHLRGLGFDRAEVEPVFQQYAVATGVADRVVFISGDFFKDDLPTKKMLIRKAYEAVPAGGALIVYDSIIDDDRSKNAFGLMMSLNMLLETPGGFDYTGADCKGWMQEAGFSTMQVEPLTGADSMVIGIK